MQSEGANDIDRKQSSFVTEKISRILHNLSINYCTFSFFFKFNNSVQFDNNVINDNVSKTNDLNHFSIKSKRTYVNLINKNKENINLLK